MEIVEVDGKRQLEIPQNEFSKTATDTLHTVKQLLDKITWDDGVNLTAERFLCSRYAVPREMGAEIKEKRELWKEILDGRMDESSIPEGESWLYLEDTAGLYREATYRLKIWRCWIILRKCYKTKKKSNNKHHQVKLSGAYLLSQFRPFRHPRRFYNLCFPVLLQCLRWRGTQIRIRPARSCAKSGIKDADAAAALIFTFVRRRIFSSVPHPQRLRRRCQKPVDVFMKRGRTSRAMEHTARFSSSVG